MTARSAKNWFRDGPPVGGRDTSVVIDLALIAPDRPPAASAITAVTMAELAAGPHATDDVVERALRQQRARNIDDFADVQEFLDIHGV